jgi:hypothetical protein
MADDLVLHSAEYNTIGYSVIIYQFATVPDNAEQYGVSSSVMDVYGSNRLDVDVTAVTGTTGSNRDYISIT